MEGAGGEAGDGGRPRYSTEDGEGGRRRRRWRRASKLLDMAVFSLLFFFAVAAEASAPLRTPEAGLVAALLNANVTRYVLTEDIKLTKSLPEAAGRESLQLIGGCGGGRRCAIDGGGRYAGLQISETDFTLINLELRNMRGDNGAAVYSTDSYRKKATNCVFRNNRANDSGGAIYYQDGWFEFDSCLFEGNRAINGFGGAVSKSTDYGSAIFMKTVFKKNVAKVNGGAVWFKYSNVHFRSCQFLENKAMDGYGGGISLASVHSTIAGSKFERNSAPKGLGGAMRLFIYDADITVCGGNTYARNRATNSSDNLSVAGDDSEETEVMGTSEVNFCGGVASMPAQTLIESQSRLIKESCDGCSKMSGWIE